MNGHWKTTLLVCLATAAAAPAQGTRILVGAPPTRTFSEAECTFTLPASDWQWIDPHTTRHGKVVPIAVARNHWGFEFQLLVSPRTEPVHPGSYQDFEDGFFSSGEWRKVDSRHLDVKGVPSYQFVVESVTGSKACSIRVLLANNKTYDLRVIKCTGGVPTESESEAILSGFKFIDEPRPLMSPPKSVHETESELQRGQQYSALGNTAVVTIGVASLLFLFTCFVIWFRRVAMPED